MISGITTSLFLAGMIAQAQIDPDAVKWDEPKADGANVFDQFEKADAPPPEKLGSGPHTLVISDGKGMTRIDYKTGPACQKARDEVRRQVAPPPSAPGVIYGLPTTKAFCVPR